MTAPNSIRIDTGYPTVLALNPGHDGAIAALSNGSLTFSIEAEKDSFPRYMPAGPRLFVEALKHMRQAPDIVALSGWDQDDVRDDRGYFGTSERLATLKLIPLFGRSTHVYESTHERSHLFCSYGLSPFEQGRPCYALLWEGIIGTFYEIDSQLRIKRLDQVLPAPGYKYSFLFDLADPSQLDGGFRLESAGKLMALSAYSSHGPRTEEEEEVIQKILKDVLPTNTPTPKSLFAGSRYLNCGVRDSAFRELAGKFSDAIFDLFYQFARTRLIKRLPLLISGGCGLNCEWNTRWRESGLFEDVFVPPVANDSGSAIGTAIEAQFRLAGRAKVQWSVYSGLEFERDSSPDDFIESPVDFDEIARIVVAGKIVAWVQGRYEIGPRALGNRSLIAAPFKEETRCRLNDIKQREDYRPIAPVCLQEDGCDHFGMNNRPSPYMLFFHMVKTTRLRAVTHVDGSARVQTVSPADNPALYKLLHTFKEQTGFGVLCNTSLNFPGRGFINRSSDLFRYVRSKRIDAVVIDDKMYLPK